MKFIQKIAASALLSAVAFATPAFAESPLVSRMQAYVVEVNDKGEETYKPAEKAAPKQVIEYRLVYENTSEKALKELAVTGPIPKNTKYVPASAATMVNSAFRVSIDGGKSWEGEPVKRKRLNAQGEIEEVIIPPTQYTHVRWQANKPLGAESQQEYRYRVRLN